jgi:uncharacterized protein (DUF1499 family)
MQKEVPMDGWSKFLWLVPVLMVGCSGTRPTTLGVREGRMAPCPKSPNCVSTQSTDAKHRIDPLAYATSIEDARTRLLTIVRSTPRTSLVTEQEDYLHVEYRSRIFGFVDDVEFLFDDESKIIHFRSASRKGYSDLGVNRKRMEEIRERFSGIERGR